MSEQHTYSTPEYIATDLTKNSICKNAVQLSLGKWGF